LAAASNGDHAILPTSSVVFEMLLVLSDGNLR
jgi:hypothetical protein